MPRCMFQQRASVEGLPVCGVSLESFSWIMIIIQHYWRYSNAKWNKLVTRNHFYPPSHGQNCLEFTTRLQIPRTSCQGSARV